jgi:hypothetical protein
MDGHRLSYWNYVGIVGLIAVGVAIWIALIVLIDKLFASQHRVLAWATVALVIAVLIFGIPVFMTGTVR